MGVAVGGQVNDVLRVLLWNVEWASMRSVRGRIVQQLIAASGADVVCLTEATLSLVPDGVHTAMSEADYGYAAPVHRRKVVMWSTAEWGDVDPVGATAMPGGRFVAGTCRGIRWMGVCVPWRAAHVTTGRHDRRPWQDHVAYLEELALLVESTIASGERLVVLGDVNQRIPRVSQPAEVFEVLDRLRDAGLVCPSADDAGYVTGMIDHVLIGPGVEVGSVKRIPRTTDDGARVSDHDGLLVELGLRR